MARVARKPDQGAQGVGAQTHKEAKPNQPPYFASYVMTWLSEDDLPITIASSRKGKAAPGTPGRLYGWPALIIGLA